ncbi:MAG: zinc-binding dehydrogenase [Armatimonadetes bacterium]|nr:zinc-binding dehydrogenase [Armatimonadota bacterium]
MRAVVVREHGDVDRLLFEEIETPRALPGEVLIEVRACGLNHLDLWVRKGVPGHRFPLPLIPGCDIAGVVRALGPGVTGIEPGLDAVVSPGVSCGKCRACLYGNDNLCRHYGILGETRHGGYAEFASVPFVNVIPKPARLSFEEVAAIPLVFLTAWHMLVTRAGLRPGEDVLIHAAGSGVGSAAIQIAKLWGARVLATAGSLEKLEKARALGADELIPYREEDFTEAVRRLTGKRGVDVVLDHVGGDTFSGSVACLAKGGRLITCGATSGADIKLDLHRVFFKSLSILGSTMGSKAEVLEVFRFVEQGKLKPVIDRVIPFTSVRDAHRLLDERGAFGKIILKP